MGSDNLIKQELLIVPVAESSAETLNACGEAIRPVFIRDALLNQEEQLQRQFGIIIPSCPIWVSLSER